MGKANISEFDRGFVASALELMNGLIEELTSITLDDDSGDYLFSDEAEELETIKKRIAEKAGLEEDESDDD